MADTMSQPDARAALIALVELGQSDEEAYRAALSETERHQVGTAEQWAPKEVVAHLAFWKNRQTARIEAATRGEESPDGSDDWGQLNTETWPEHAQLTWSECVVRSDQATRDLLAALRNLPAEALVDLEDPASPGNLLVSTTLGNSLGHVAQHMADYYLSHGDRDRARKVQQDAVQAIVASQLGSVQDAFARYNLACYYALNGQPADALDELRVALAAHPDLVPWARQDHDLDSLRDDPAFQALVPPAAEEA